MLLEKETYLSWLARIPLHTPLGPSSEVGVMYVTLSQTGGTLNVIELP